MSLSLQFADSTHCALLPRHRVARWVSASLSHSSEITVRTVGADEGRTLNREYRDKDHATNVLTFDHQHTPVVMADLILCAPVIAQEACEQRIDIAAHCAHLLVHGTLHA